MPGFYNGNMFCRDQELRYTVHDSPDYYQLKVSVFNDDKKTELIGETWVDLKEVVIPGGGQNDLWHNLGCKGKYAGEIRIEITYYDSRPKQEKPEAVKQAGTNWVDDGGRDSLKGPRQPKAAVKRRPLPSDPVTGAAPVVIPDHVQTAPRGYPPSPTAVPDHGQTPPRGYQYPSSAADHVQTPPRGYQQPNAAQDYGPTPPRAYQQQPVAPDHGQTPPRGYQNQPSAIPDHVQTPQRGYQSPNYIPNQSPLQNVEYNTPPQQYPPSQGYENSPRTNGYGPPPGTVAVTPTARPVSNGRYEIYDPAPRDDYSPGGGRDYYGGQDYDHRDRYDSRQNSYDAPQQDEYGSPQSPGGPPPPPPAHRSRKSINGSAHVSPAPIPHSYGSYGFPPDNRPTDPYDPISHDDRRNSMVSYSQSNPYQAYSPGTSPGKEQDPFRRSPSGNHEQPPSRHKSYDSRYHGDYGSMQASVEDVPESPGGAEMYNQRGSMSRASPYDQVPSPAPLNLSGRNSESGRNSMTNTPSHQYSNSANGHSTTNSQGGSFRDRSHTDTSASSQTSYSPMPQQQDQRLRGHSQGQIQATNYAPPPVPATLVPGMDPMIAQEISDRIYNEKRASYAQGPENPPRGRNQNSAQYQSNQPKLLSYHESSALVPFVPASSRYDDQQSRYSADDQQSRYAPSYAPSVDDRQSRYSNSVVAVVKPRGVSPDPRRATTRKSVSPAPPVRESDDKRRLSGIPFGPDSYNAFNPVVSNSPSAPSLSAAYEIKDIDADAKIITHDGREIDPSDHIPESNYAPLLEKKGPKYASQQPDRNYRPPPTQQPISATGRRPLRQAAPRPQSMAASSPIYMNNGSSGPDPVTPTGRNRLQKKSNRMSAQPAPNSSPLGPLTLYQDNSYVPRGPPRSSTMDYNANENYAPSYGTSPSYRGATGPPPIPAKVPMALPPQPGGGDPWALLEEMKNIDLGSGRARRRQY